MEGMSFPVSIVLSVIVICVTRILCELMKTGRF